VIYSGCSKSVFTIAGGSPAAGYFLLRRQKKVTQEKATPVCRAAFLQDRRRTLDSQQIAGLRNSHDPLRGHVLKQSSPNCTAICQLSSAARRGYG